MDEPTLIAAVRAAFPELELLLLWGGTQELAATAAPVGDIDLMLVLPALTDGTEARLATLATTLADAVAWDWDLAASTRAELAVAAPLWVTPHRARRGHGMDGYQLRSRSRVLWGEPALREAFYHWSVASALADCGPFVLDRFCPLLRQALAEASSAAEVIAAYRDVILVLVRTVVSARTGTVQSKAEALATLGRLYPELADLLETPRRETLERLVVVTEEVLNPSESGVAL